MTKVTTPTGTLRTKIQPQRRCWLMNPPISGPDASAMAPAAFHTPKAVVRSRASSNVARMIASVAGTSSAAPRPCTARLAISTAPLPASPAASEAGVKIARPIRNIRRRP